MVQAEQAHAVGNLFPNPIKACQVSKGSPIIHRIQQGKVQGAGHGVLAKLVYVFGAVSQFQFLKLIQ